MANTIAIAKKSGKRFEVIDQTEISVVLKDVESGEEKEIKQGTFAKGYTIEAPVDIKEVSEEQYKVFFNYDYELAKTFSAERGWEITFVHEEDGFNGDCYVVYKSVEDIPEGWMRDSVVMRVAIEQANIENGVKSEHTEQVPQQEQPKQEGPDAYKPYVVELINALGDNKKVEAIIASVASTVPANVTLTEDMAEAVRLRDNNRQCFKENQNRFKIAVENKDEEKYLLSYAHKMVEYYAKYFAAKTFVDELKAKKVATKDTNETQA